ncbi:MAG: glycosyltransferase family 39 protein, partial [Candidatus Moraniibacteriota bacterium]
MKFLRSISKKYLSQTTLILLMILCVGIFLRTYQFHDWLDFKSDQSRDALLVSDVIDGKTSWPLLGAVMDGSAETTDKQFRIGPFYYYFQIISAKIFGNYPDVLAYPDLLFSILSILLFFFFLRKYFNQKIALLLCGLYSISFFSVRFAHFAWNSNSIPFFALLLLLSLYEFKTKKERVSWWYVVFLGIAWGIGFQLHAISMILFSLVCLYFFISSIVTTPSLWKKWLVVLVLFFVLNIGQIVDGVQNNFSNTKIFFQFFTKNSSSSNEDGTLIVKV